MTRLLALILCLSLLTASCSPDSGAFIEYNIGILSVVINSNGEISFAASSPDFTLPFFLGTVRVGFYHDAAVELGVLNTLTIRIDGKDHVYDLHGQDLNVELSSGYYEKIRLQYDGRNILLVVQSSGEIMNDPNSPSSSTNRSQSLSGFSCSGAFGPSFQIGDRFYVPPGNGSRSVWEEPNNVPRIGRIPEYGQGTIIGGPVCKQGQEGSLVTWMIRSDSGLEGWVAEGYHHSPVPWIAPVN